MNLRWAWKRREEGGRQRRREKSPPLKAPSVVVSATRVTSPSLPASSPRRPFTTRLGVCKTQEGSEVGGSAVTPCWPP